MSPRAAGRGRGWAAVPVRMLLLAVGDMIHRCMCVAASLFAIKCCCFWGVSSQHRLDTLRARQACSHAAHHAAYYVSSGNICTDTGDE
jgi:hypothetical protein